MKPKDLIVPFGNERRVMIHDRIWHVPRYRACDEAFVFPGWHSPELFGNDKPVVIEYCCGNGTWIAAKAQQDPSCNWLGVEMRFERVRKVWSKIHNLNLDNLMVVNGEALVTTQRYIPAQSVQDVYVNFPDPWPKKRHAKHRLLQGPFINELQRILHPGGAVTVVTDDVDYSEQLIAEFAPFPSFQSAFADPFYATEWPNYGGSYFDSLWRGQGKTIRYHRFVLTAAISHD